MLRVLFLIVCIVLICGCPRKSKLVQVQTKIEVPADSISVIFLEMFTTAVSPWINQTSVRHALGERELFLAVRLTNDRRLSRYWGEIKLNGHYYSGFILETKQDAVVVKKCNESPKLLRKGSGEHYFDIGLIKKDQTGVDIQSLARNYINEGAVRSFIADSLSREQGVKLIVTGMDSRTNEMVSDTLGGDRAEDFFFDGLNVALLHPCGWYYPLITSDFRAFDPIEKD